jgi:hypothetical protein
MIGMSNRKEGANEEVYRSGRACGKYHDGGRWPDGQYHAVAPIRRQAAKEMVAESHRHAISRVLET